MLRRLQAVHGSWQEPTQKVDPLISSDLPSNQTIPLSNPQCTTTSNTSKLPGPQTPPSNSSPEVVTHHFLVTLLENTIKKMSGEMSTNLQSLCGEMSANLQSL